MPKKQQKKTFINENTHCQDLKFIIKEVKRIRIKNKIRRFNNLKLLYSYIVNSTENRLVHIQIFFELRI